MKVLVIGGAGVFGSRLAGMLVRDGHAVTVAGRSEARTRAAAHRLGTAALTLDLAGDLSPVAGFDAVVDAAGPFHAYGADPYRLARTAIAAGVHYLDFSDNIDFTTSLAALDAEAMQAGVFALSGVSSVPAVSSAAVLALREGLDTLDQIDSAILPGNRAPRGRSVVESILAQAGQPLTLTLDGQPVTVRSWSRPRTYDLGPYCRTAHMIGVPDVALLPGATGAGTVLFRAGLELWIMRAGLALWAATGRVMPGWMRRLVHLAAGLLYPFGTDWGGMVVEVTGRQGSRWLRRSWRLRVTDGQGPYIPGIAARALLRDPAAVPPGAGPAIGPLTLPGVEAALTDLAAETEVREAELIPLFRRALGPAFDTLAGGVKASHDSPCTRVLTGNGTVTRGRGPIARIAAALFRFPPAGTDVPVMVIKWPDGQGGEVWERRFGGKVFRSHLRMDGTRITESFGPFTFAIGLHAQDGALHFPVTAGRLGPLPIPRRLLPVSEAVETGTEDGQTFDVTLRAPLTGALIVRYRGRLARAQTA